MNSNIAQLYQIASKPQRRIIGLMSGTSLDGLDVALCRFSGSGGQTSVKVEQFMTIPFSEEVKQQVREVFAKSTISFEQLCLLNPWLGNLHGQLVKQCLAEWGVAAHEVDCIASHGQTVFHAPKILHQRPDFPNATLQIGDGDHLAMTTGILTLSDFRQKHCAAGGEGAPLAVYGDYLIFSQEGQTRLLLNMGGIANFTYLPANLDANAVFATDTGPGNTLLDAYTQEHFGRAYDADAAIARQGSYDLALLAALKNHAFFEEGFPKTTGPELFNKTYLAEAQASSHTEHLSGPDVLATLCRFTAETIADAIRRVELPAGDTAVYVSGGGAHNPLIMEHLAALLPDFYFRKTSELGIDGDAKEAVLFATLANEALAGGRTDFGTREGVPSVSMGKISFAG